MFGRKINYIGGIHYEMFVDLSMLQKGVYLQKSVLIQPERGQIWSVLSKTWQNHDFPESRPNPIFQKLRKAHPYPIILNPYTPTLVMSTALCTA